MEIFTVQTLVKATILLYLTAGFLALVLMKHHKLCNVVSNIMCILASVMGIAASLIQIIYSTGSIQFNVYSSVIPFISIDLTMDKLSAFFLLGLTVLTLCVSIYSIGYISHYYGKRNVGLFNFLYSTFILSMLLVITAGNAAFFFIAWEIMSVISYFLVVFESEHKSSQDAGTLYIIMTHIGTAFLLAGFMIMFSYTGSFSMFAGSSAIPDNAKNVMFILFLIGFGTKAGVIPLHIWLPHAHPAAPSNVSALMSGIMIKTAIYGLIRFLLCYLNIQHTWWGVVILCIGIVSAVLGVAYALMEHNIKRLLAFHSVENIGIILIGLGVCFIAFAQKNELLGSLALIASLLHTFNHALFKGGLFLGAGSIQYSTHTKDIEKLGGLIKVMPITGVLILCFSLAISAIVPFNGFISEWLTYQSLFANIAPGQAGLNIISILSVAALALSGALAAACFVKFFGISFLGLPRSSHASNAKEVPHTMNAGMMILAALCLTIGLFPLIIIRLIDNVIYNIAGVSIYQQLSGGFLIAYYPLNVSGNSISPFEIVIIIAVIIISFLILMRLFAGKYSERRYGTWDCGFEALNSRMQYSATGFANPLRIVFRILFRPSRKFTVEGNLPYHPTSMEYSVTIEPIFEKYLYFPAVKHIRRLSRKTKYLIQTGSINAYLIYIFAAVIALLLYNRFI